MTRPTLHSPGSRRGLGLRLAMILSWLAAACSRPGTDPTPAPLAVLAAASLTEAFAEIETQFEAANPGVDVVVSTAGSQVLRVQIEQGAPADVFASANAEHMQALVTAGLARGDVLFAEGELVLVVPPANPAGLRSLEDLPRATRIVLGGPEVPVGKYTRTMLDRAEGRYGAGFRARVEEHVVSLEPNVRQVLAKVELGEADAAVVYRSDVAAARAVTVIEIPPELGVRAQYHAGVVQASAQPAVAERFVEHLRSPAARAVLVHRGFLAVDG